VVICTPSSICSQCVQRRLGSFSVLSHGAPLITCRKYRWAWTEKIMIYCWSELGHFEHSPHCGADWWLSRPTECWRRALIRRPGAPRACPADRPARIHGHLAMSCLDSPRRVLLLWTSFGKIVQLWFNNKKLFIWVQCDHGGNKIVRRNILNTTWRSKKNPIIAGFQRHILLLLDWI